MSARSDFGGLSPDEARRVYNRVGRFQDWQRFYEAAPVEDLIDHAQFASASAVYELGCGTGALAERLLERDLGSDAMYHAVDISDTMVRLATRRLAPWADRCKVDLVDGRSRLPGAADRFDRFVATYVFDLFDEGEVKRTLAEARRLLAPDGRLCLVSLTRGSRPLSRAVLRGWEWVWSRAPQLVGGCRPVALEPLLTPQWQFIHHRIVTAWSIPSEVVVATPAPGSRT